MAVGTFEPTVGNHAQGAKGHVDNAAVGAAVNVDGVKTHGAIADRKLSHMVSVTRGIAIWVGLYMRRHAKNVESSRVTGSSELRMP